MARLRGIDISDSPEDLVCYGFDASDVRGSAAMVAWPKSTAEISELMKHASEKDIPVVPRGAGTGMTAGSVPLKDGRAMVVSLERMNRILEADGPNLSVVVEPGVINGNLQRALKPHGLFYPPDPASLEFCTLGGNVAENAGGPRALKYGVTRDYVMEIEAVLPSGEVINTGVRTHKGVVGYDLARVLTGSEGTLAVLSKLRLKVLPAPAGVRTMLAYFGDVLSTGRAVTGIMASGVMPRTLEVMDRGAIDAVESFRPCGFPHDVGAMLLIELDGHEAAMAEEAARVAGVCEALGARVETAQGEDERERLWGARRAVSPALHHLGMRKINEDVVVPMTRLPEMLVYLAELSDKTGVRIVNFGHAGDGNIHVNIMCEKGDDARYEYAMTLVRTIFVKVLEFGGTISGEHGVGLTKADYISMEIMERELGLMKGIKGLFDPRGIMNPGKIFG